MLVKIKRRPSFRIWAFTLFSSASLSFSCGGKNEAPDYPQLSTDAKDSATLEAFERPPSPSTENIVFERQPEKVWAEGRWVWTPDGWNWEAGSYIDTRTGFVFVQGRWVQQDSKWTYTKPNWIEARLGQVWVRGYWEETDGQRTWIPGRWASRRPNHTWQHGRWEQRGNKSVWVNGRWRKNDS